MTCILVTDFVVFLVTGYTRPEINNHHQSAAG